MKKENEIIAIDTKHNDELPDYDLSQSFSDICVQFSNAKTVKTNSKSSKKVVKK